MAEYTGNFTAGQGGVMTDEVGVVTGDLTLRTQLDDGGGLVLRVRYRDADEWYTVTGGHTTLSGQADGKPVHELVLGVLARGGKG